MFVEAEISAEREAHEPVGGEVAEHRSASVAGAAKGTGGHSLNAVEELEGGASDQENCRAVDYRFVGGVEAGDVTREDQQDNTHHGHEGSAELNGGIASVAGTSRIAAAQGLPDSNGGCGR